ncbi:MAG: hypothetical protein IIB54_11170 [Planctomycetes bacterium]|nr:hypothetical protein [Planctomycetota bacterium]
MSSEQSWRELYRSNDLHEASMIATCIAAMEFEVVLSDATGQHIDKPSPHQSRPPFIVKVTSACWAQLNDVLEEIIEEQMQFDSYLSSWHETAARWEKHMLVLLIAIVMVLATFGLINL